MPYVLRRGALRRNCKFFSCVIVNMITEGVKNPINSHGLLPVLGVVVTLLDANHAHASTQLISLLALVLHGRESTHLTSVVRYFGSIKEFNRVKISTEIILLGMAKQGIKRFGASTGILNVSDNGGVW